LSLLKESAAVHVVGIIGLAIGAIVNMVVGTRMLTMAIKNRREPELMLAILMLVGGVFGLALLNIAQRVHVLPPEAKPLLASAGVGCQYVAALAQLRFAWVVFRPGQSWATAFYLTFTAAVVAGYVVDILSGSYIGYAGEPMRSLHFAYGLALRNVTAIILAVESYIFLGKLKRQLAIGLTSSHVVRSVRLWVLALSMVAVLYTIAFAYRLATGESASAAPAAIATMGLLAASAGVCFWLAFLRRGDPEPAVSESHG
jgi:Na+-transporting methylmalonyl-CoA/oxaloacetate decarboxylase beta subunit